MEDLLDPLQPIDEDRRLLLRYLDGLEAAHLPVERADLAGAIAVLAARYENVLTDAFYPQIVESLGMRDTIARGDDLQSEARLAIEVVRDDLRDVAPIDAHAGDPERVDAAIDAMAVSLRSLLEFEDAELFTLIDHLTADELPVLRERIAKASLHQTSLPDPPVNGLIRKLAEVKESIGLALNDHSTEWHPGIERVEGGRS